MGKKTFESIGRLLPNRNNVVVTTQLELSIDGVEIINDIEHLKDLQDTWFIGGANLLEQVWPMITEFHLTRASDAYDCDTYINLLYLEQNFARTHEYLFDDNTYEIWLRK